LAVSVLDHIRLHRKGKGRAPICLYATLIWIQADSIATA